MKTRILRLGTILFIVYASAACGVVDRTVNGVASIVGEPDTATVIAKSAQIRTSYAVVAADLLEVKRGDRLEIIDQTEFEKVQWLRVRARDEAQTEGWIEAQNVITSDVLEKSKQLADQFKGVPAQAAGQLRAASNLRLSADMNADNVLFKLANGSTFEIMSWKFVPKQVVGEGDDAAKGETKSAQKAKNEEIEAARDDSGTERLDEKYDIWYEIRLDPSVSPAPAGWLFGRQVELVIPSDIVFYQPDRGKFVAWQRLDTESADKTVTSDKVSTPGNWVALSRSSAVKATVGDEPYFDGIRVLAFDKYDQSYYTAWRSTGDLWGRLPLRVEGTGDNKTFTVSLRAADGTFADKKFVLFKDKNRLKVTPPDDLSQFQQPKTP